ncbi:MULTISPECIES: J domain-containing protein [unclassified Prochlorococcus]|uniref:J domain-containing protein n=1 Tax=unclassified Prochlorococcus TaxID=2627481 RepID=UPI000533A2E6|nr:MULTISPECIES: J domain-containing protein [unclassified Prochlorococcus]KGG16815.1 putative heat shock protein DnaJ [Prochlorococcus sp. MIT 0602]KGG18211.1 putative heat shock protein DnaJ [Prochlorococcus sp. MIT 0603]
MKQDPYKVLGISHNSELKEIKAAYRKLAKKYHPDTGGDQNKILAINAAWEKLRNDKTNGRNSPVQENSKRNHEEYQVPKKKGHVTDHAIGLWIKIVYSPIDRLMGEILNQFPVKLKELSADPYDDMLMGCFCKYITSSQRKINQAKDIYQSHPTPVEANYFSLSLYQCFSEIQDGINEWERYTSGYVENYLHDGNEMLRQASKMRLKLKKERKHLTAC